MAHNQRLADAVRASGRPLEDLAGDVGAHPKTVERWISSGRVPHATTRGKLASLLGVPAPMLWPEVPGAAYGISEVVGVYTTRNELSPSTVGSMLDAATAHVDVLAYAAMWLWDAVPRFRDRLRERIAAGVSVRICLGDPASDAVGLRGLEEGLGQGMEGRCRIALGYAMDVLDADSVRISGATLYNSIFRFDDEVLANMHFWGNPASESPVLHLKRSSDSGIAANLLRSFDRVWDLAQPLAE